MIAEDIGLELFNLMLICFKCKHSSGTLGNYHLGTGPQYMKSTSPFKCVFHVAAHGNSGEGA